MEWLDSTPKTRLETTGSGFGNRSRDVVPCCNPLVLCHNQNLGSGKGVRSQLCVAPERPFRQLTPDPFTRPTPKLNGDKAPDLIDPLSYAQGHD